MRNCIEYLQITELENETDLEESTGGNETWIYGLVLVYKPNKWFVLSK